MSKKSKDQSTVRKAQTRGRHARGIGLRPFVCTRRHLRSFAQGLALITLSLDWSQHFALYVQGVLPNASDLNHGTNVTLYVQGGIADAPGLNRVSQVALYVQGLVLTTSLAGLESAFRLVCTRRDSRRLGSGPSQPSRLVRTRFGAHHSLAGQESAFRLVCTRRDSRSLGGRPHPKCFSVSIESDTAFEVQLLPD